MSTDINKTQHYTTKSQEICSNLLQYIPDEAKLIEPFVGGGDLVSLLPDRDWELYDIEPTIVANTQDTLLNPPDYKDKWVITNPPYLAKNKATDKTLFLKYGLDDLYKIFLMSVLEADGGIVILPTNFFTDERTESVRKAFLSKFSIKEINIYTEPIFESTTYSVCAFAFQKGGVVKEQSLKCNIFPSGKQVSFKVSESSGFRFAGEYFKDIASQTSNFTRLMRDRSPEGFITNIKLYAIDTRQHKIRLKYEPELFYGISTDRSYATLVSKKELTEDEQKQIISAFNEELNSFRERYYDLVLTNYRDYNRKRIGFDFAYKLLTKIMKELNI